MATKKQREKRRKEKQAQRLPKKIEKAKMFLEENGYKVENIKKTEKVLQ